MRVGHGEDRAKRDFSGSGEMAVLAKTLARLAKTLGVEVARVRGSADKLTQPREWQESELIIYNLPDEITENAVREVFQDYGKLTAVRIQPRRSRAGRYCAVVTFESPSAAGNCLRYPPPAWGLVVRHLVEARGKGRGRGATRN